MELIKTKAWESLVIIKLIIGTGAGEQDGVGGGETVFFCSLRLLCFLWRFMWESVFCVHREFKNEWFPHWVLLLRSWRNWTHRHKKCRVKGVIETLKRGSSQYQIFTLFLFLYFPIPLLVGFNFPCNVLDVSVRCRWRSSMRNMVAWNLHVFVS